MSIDELWEKVSRQMLLMEQAASDHLEVSLTEKAQVATAYAQLADVWVSIYLAIYGKPT